MPTQKPNAKRLPPGYSVHRRATLSKRSGGSAHRERYEVNRRHRGPFAVAPFLFLLFLHCVVVLDAFVLTLPPASPYYLSRERENPPVAPESFLVLVGSLLIKSVR